MKKLINKETELTETTKEAGEEPVVRNLGFVDLILIALNVTPQGGWDTSIMRKHLRVEAKLEGIELGAEFELEDADFELVRELCKPGKIKWKMKSKDVLDLEDHLEEVAKQK